MGLPRLCRQWDIYRAKLGEPSDVWLLVLSSTQTNEILGSTLVACEIVPEHVHRLRVSPLGLPVRMQDSGLDWAAGVSLTTLATLPRNCLVALEGRLEPLTLRASVLRGLGILFGTEDWP